MRTRLARLTDWLVDIAGSAFIGGCLGALFKREFIGALVALTLAIAFAVFSAYRKDRKRRWKP